MCAAAHSNWCLFISFYMLDGEIKLIENAVKGKASAFGLLYDHYQPKIYRFVLIKIGRREDAEDITHQVFLNAWQNITNYKDLGFPFSSWLYRIAKNQVIDRYRTKRQEVDIDSVDEEISSEDSGINEDLETKIQLERVMKMIAVLKQDYQDVLIMRFVEDLSIKEVAAVIEKSEGAVKLMQHRAIKELKRIFDADGKSDVKEKHGTD
jgi:RNA polymerase sigma-70 factor, ECF subfamily